VPETVLVERKRRRRHSLELRSNAASARHGAGL